MDDLNCRKKFELFIKQNGFILLESLVSLSLLTFILLFSIPLTVNLVSYLEMERIEIEFDRALYDASKVWQRSTTFSKSYQSFHQTLEVVETKNAIKVEGDQIEEKKLEILSINWNE